MNTSVCMIPESAPFNPEQREWLNGFFAGWLGVQEASSSLALMDMPAGSISADNPESVGDLQDDEEDLPWHDGGIPIEERLALAEGRPLKLQLMAAMAQLNCGSCGYVCKTYAEAIANGEESNLKLCSPGGKETSKKLKELMSDSSGIPGNHEPRHGHALQNEGGTQSREWSRQNPFPARVVTVRNLNGSGSAKQTSHVEIDLTGSGLTYEVGDSLGVYPTNCHELVESVITALKAQGNETIEVPGSVPMTLRQALQERYCLSEITEELLGVMRLHCPDHETGDRLSRIIEDDSTIEGWDVLDLLDYLPSINLPTAELVSSLATLMPRLYSISSSFKAHPGHVHLTVGRVSWTSQNRTRKGVTSTMFADRVGPQDTVRVFVQKSHGFTVPSHPQTGMIMIGPGTGIAPFRAFLQERVATQATGPNWLFFGDQKSATDFLYQDELQNYLSTGALNRLDTAFSRDSDEKLYVQHRMAHAADELFHWLQGGAHVYVCGDAKRMAVDVDRALHTILAQRIGGAEQATAYLEKMKKEKRYCRDVY